MATTEDRARVVVCDAGPLIHLDELGELALLCDFAEVLVPDAVRAEVEYHRPGVFAAGVHGLRVRAATRAPTVELLAMSRLFPLHAGETEAIQLALECGAELLLTDDTAARLAARHLGIGVHGTLGVLLRAIRRGQRTPKEVVQCLRAIPTCSTLHLKHSLLEEIIEQVLALVRAAR